MLYNKNGIFYTYLFTESEENMKHSLKLISLALCIMLFAALLTVSAFAVRGDYPAAYGSQSVCKSHPGKLVTLSDICKTASIRNKGPMRAPSLKPAVADLPLLVIVVGFNDMPYSETFDWSSEIFDADYSLSEFYTDMSSGKFTFTPARETSAYGGTNTNTADSANDGIIHVKANMNHDDWTFDYPFLSRKDIATNQTFAQALTSAISAADAYVDFSAYDINEDGSISTDELALGFVIAGYEASSSGSYKNGKELYLWSNAWSLEELKDAYGFSFGIPKPDGVSVSSYIAISEMEEDKTQEPISTLAHELGHYIGLPDLYDTDYNNSEEWSKYDVGALSLMNVESWFDTETNEMHPTPIDIWSKSILGWITPSTADSSGTYSIIRPNYQTGSSGTALRIPTQNKDEYYLLENRGVSKWDRPMQAEYNSTGGIILWHIDDSVYDEYNDDNSINNSNHRPSVMPLYPEKDSSGNFCFIGDNKAVLIDSPFFDKATWEGSFSSLGATLNLPVYGTGSSADLRSGRTLSGIKLQFLNNKCSSMTVLINPDEHVHHAVKAIVKEPTCTEKGEAIYECVLCGKRFTDENCIIETDETVFVDALGHTSPDSNGKCTRCGILIVDESDLCPYCGGFHGSSFAQRIIAFFHKILYFFAHLFGTK